MKQPIENDFYKDDDGNPAGGTSHAFGIAIDWQDGPVADYRPESANGAFVETLIQMAVDRLTFYQTSKFSCEENATAILNLKLALEALDKRTANNRKARGVEGTHIP